MYGVDNPLIPHEKIVVESASTEMVSSAKMVKFSEWASDSPYVMLHTLSMSNT